MGQSLCKNYIHIVFSTKNRQPLIRKEVERQLHAYMAAICIKLECQPIQIGGYNDHIHILCSLSKKIALMKLLEEVKSHSSKWIKTKGADYESYYWQDGYAAFSVDRRALGKIKQYIESQEEHHANKDYKTEVREILSRNDIEFDERYVWD